MVAAAAGTGDDADAAAVGFVGHLSRASLRGTTANHPCRRRLHVSCIQTADESSSRHTRSTG